MNGFYYRIDRIKRGIWTAILAAYTGAIFYASVYPVGEGPSIVTFPGIDKIVHAGEFALFALICYRTIGYYTGREMRRLGLIATSVFVGGLTELVQLLFPYRTASFLDWFADLAGVAIGLALIIVIEKWKAKKERTNPDRA